jgi:hypothetical protein
MWKSLLGIAASAVVGGPIGAAAAIAYSLKESSVGKSIVDNYVRDTVYPAEGSVVYCDLAGVVEHSGVYVGGGRIVHLDGSGTIEVVSAEQFIRRQGGLNPAITIYVSCRGGEPVYSPATARRALEYVNKTREYSVLFDNCHQFTAGCVTGEPNNPDNFFSFLTWTIEKLCGHDNWRAWDR